MADKTRTLAEAGPRIEQFLNTVFRLANFTLNFTVREGETPHPDFENPDLLTDRRMRDVEFARGERDATEPGSRLETSERS